MAVFLENTEQFPEHMKRVVEEYKELKAKFLKLQVYVNNGCPGADAREKDLLKTQLTNQEDLTYTLERRIRYAQEKLLKEALTA